MATRSCPPGERVRGLAPFPDVAGGVVQAEAVGLVGVDRAGAVPAVGRRVAAREVALPDVHPGRPPGSNSSPQGNTLAAVRPGRRVPIPPRWAGACRPRRSRRGRRPSRRARPDDPPGPPRWSAVRRAAPVGTLDLPPPGGGRHRPGGREVVREQTGEDERPADPLGRGTVPVSAAKRANCALDTGRRRSRTRRRAPCAPGLPRRPGRRARPDCP